MANRTSTDLDAGKDKQDTHPLASVFWRDEILTFTHPGHAGVRARPLLLAPVPL